jgi:GR25 family glycosyltransferase involved in LPS biosynthesis
MSSWTVESIPAFCITLERRLDRWKRFQDQPGIDPLSLKRFIGVDGKTIDLDNDDRITTLTKRNIMMKSRRSHEELDSIGGVGCALSHIAVWQWLVDSEHDMVLIFEDDAVVPPNFVSLANQCIEKSTILKDPKKWDMWLLGGIWDDLTKIPGEETVFRIGSYVLFHGYILTKRAARMFLKGAYPIHAHIDIWVSVYSYLNDIRIVGCKKLMLRQNEKVKTDIQSEKGCKICNVPTDYDKKYSLVPKTTWQIAQGAEVVAVILAGFIVYQNFIRRN